MASTALTKYSPTERSLLGLIPTGGRRINSAELIQLHYGRKPPFNARQAINTAMRQLMLKVSRNKEPFILAKSDRRGPHPIEYWKEKR